jgi:serine/threonine protein phosphatase 1
MRWIIGDIHGMLRPLEALVRAIDRHDPQRQLLFVGDFVNRGPDSKGVIDLLLALPDAHVVRGNHDDVFDQVLSGQSCCAKPGEQHRIASFKWFMQHGLDKTFQSYGITPSEIDRALHKPSDRSIDYLIEPIPQEHRLFIRNLPLVLESDDMFVAHAKWDINTATEKPPISQRLTHSEIVRYTLIWGRYRDDEIAAQKPWSRTGYFGHTPVDTYLDTEDLLPIAGPNIILLDTAAALVPHGRLTAYCHEARTFIQSDVDGKMVEARE